jgi:hypothetical protein
LPAAKPVNIIPNHGIGGYPITNILSPPSGKAPGAKKGMSILLRSEVSARGTRGAKLCKEIIARPKIAIVFREAFNNRLRIINPNPIAAITSKRKTEK